MKNLKRGVKARTKILDALEQSSFNAAAIAKEKSLSYRVVLHHLRLLENEKIVKRKGKRPYCWALTGLGQKRIVG